MPDHAFSRLLGGMLTERQVQGANHLRRAVPRPLLLLLGAFLVAYAGYWAAVMVGSDRAVLAVYEYVLGALLGLAGVVTAVRLCPRLEPALPKWFRTERAPEVMPESLRYGLGAGIALLVGLAGLAVGELTYLIIAVLGALGGLLILTLAERSVLRSVHRLLDRRPWLRAQRTPVIFLVLLALTAAVVVGGGLVIGLVGSTEGEGHRLLPGQLLVTLSVSAVILLATASLAMFTILGLWRGTMRYLARRGKRYGPRRMALQRVSPAALAAYLLGVNAVAVGLFSFYIIVIVFQAAVATEQATGVRIIEMASLPLAGALVDHAALATLALAWTLLLLNLSASAEGSDRWYLNRHVFAAASVFVVMVLFMHVIVARGDELSISILFRAAYLVGIGLAPAVVFWRRWRAMGLREA